MGTLKLATKWKIEKYDVTSKPIVADRPIKQGGWVISRPVGCNNFLILIIDQGITHGYTNIKRRYNYASNQNRHIN
jgi:hypothetical protein